MFISPAARSAAWWALTGRMVLCSARQRLQFPQRLLHFPQCQPELSRFDSEGGGIPPRPSPLEPSLSVSAVSVLFQTMVPEVGLRGEWTGPVGPFQPAAELPGAVKVHGNSS
jgi:hypothetical protein